jgi:hypothetical protein
MGVFYFFKKKEKELVKINHGIFFFLNFFVIYNNTTDKFCNGIFVYISI